MSASNPAWVCTEDLWRHLKMSVLWCSISSLVELVSANTSVRIIPKRTHSCRYCQRCSNQVQRESLNHSKKLLLLWNIVSIYDLKHEAFSVSVLHTDCWCSAVPHSTEINLFSTMSLRVSACDFPAFYSILFQPHWLLATTFRLIYSKQTVTAAQKHIISCVLVYFFHLKLLPMRL